MSCAAIKATLGSSPVSSERGPFPRVLPHSGEVRLRLTSGRARDSFGFRSPLS